jgi:peptidoglycan/LPS O-acetylase OafA/YrhL
LGVKGFFILSGFLIYQSLKRSDSKRDFYKKRFLRLFPALIVMLLLTVLMAPFVYQHEIPYLLNSTMWSYFPRNVTLYSLQWGIEGVFQDNPYPKAINGSLWTIAYEFTMYVFLSFLFIYRKQERKMQVILIGSFIIFVLGNLFFVETLAKWRFVISGVHLFDLGVYFIAGSVLAAINIHEFRHKNILLMVSSVLILAAIPLNIYTWVAVFILPIVVILFGHSSTPGINQIGAKIGDLSYGIYIYGFPVQQTLMHYYELNHWQLMGSSLVISAGLAYLSWHLIEIKALKMKSGPLRKKVKVKSALLPIDQ